MAAARACGARGEQEVAAVAARQHPAANRPPPTAASLPSQWPRLELLFMSLVLPIVAAQGARELGV